MKRLAGTGEAGSAGEGARRLAPSGPFAAIPLIPSAPACLSLDARDAPGPRGGRGARTRPPRWRPTRWAGTPRAHVRGQPGGGTPLRHAFHVKRMTRDRRVWRRRARPLLSEWARAYTGARLLRAPGRAPSLPWLGCRTLRLLRPLASPFACRLAGAARNSGGERRACCGLLPPRSLVVSPARRVIRVADAPPARAPSLPAPVVLPALRVIRVAETPARPRLSRSRPGWSAAGAARIEQRHRLPLTREAGRFM